MAYKMAVTPSPQSHASTSTGLRADLDMFLFLRMSGNRAALAVHAYVLDDQREEMVPWSEGEAQGQGHELWT